MLQTRALEFLLKRIHQKDVELVLAFQVPTDETGVAMKKKVEYDEMK
jgi:hypothetical protein